MRTWVARAAREWPLGIAIAGVLSLLLIPRVAQFGSLAVESQREELDALRRDLEAGDAALEPKIASFLDRHPGSPFSPEARLLRAQSIVARGRAGIFPGVGELNRAWVLSGKAVRSPESDAIRRDVAALLLEFGLANEAYLRFLDLYGQTRDPDLALEVARALLRRSSLEPELRQALLDDAAAKVSDFLRRAPPEARLRGTLVKARIYREEKRDEVLLQMLASELAEARSPADRGTLQMERGRTFARMGRNMEAMAALDEAERLLPDPLGRGLAMVYQAELFARAGNPECVEVCNRVLAADSPAAPFAYLVVGVHELKARPAVALEALRNGFSKILRPRVLDDAGFDLGWVTSALRAAADRESDPERLLRHAAVLGELGRLQPLSTQVGFDHAALLLRARRFEEAADRFLAIEALERIEPEDRARAVLAAADASAEGGYQLRAASIYRKYYNLKPAAHTAGLFLSAASLRKAGDVPGAMSGFEEYLVKAGPSGTYAATALLEKAALLTENDRLEDALATYDRVLKAREVATSPARDDWAVALLGRGRTLLHLERPAEAGKALREYLERYAEGPAPTPASLDAAWLLVSVAIEERQWKSGLALLRDLEALASRIPDEDRAPYSEILKAARFVEGDLQFNLEDYAAAYRAYGDAVRKHADSEDRLWGLIGRARALARLERKEEARRDYSNARAIFEAGREAFERSLAGHGRDYWEIALDALAKEVR